MATELPEDVMFITTPLLTTDGAGGGALGGAGGGALGGAAYRGAFSGSVELGRRLLLAARQGQTAQVLDLMAKGAPFATDWLGTSPLHVAAAGAHVETCAVLLRAGVSRDARTKVERTPLHLAAHAGHAAVAALLLERGALADCRDMLRMTPLHWAAERGHAACVAVLLRHGADPTAVSKFQKTPLDLAAARSHIHILKLMEDVLRDREAADSVDALRQADEQSVEIPAAEQQQALESIERLQETMTPLKKQNVVLKSQVKIEVEREPLTMPVESAESGAGGAEGGAEGTDGAAALLRKHGITLLPPDSSSTVLNAIQSGRTVVLSDAGKLMLKESSSTPVPAPAPAPAPTPTSKGVILTAAPVKATPAGVKIFTLNNKLRATDKLPIKKLVNPQDMQIKLVSLPENKMSPTKLSNVAMKAKARRSTPGGGAVGGAGGGTRTPVKIIMQKANFDKMVRGNNVENGMETGTVQITSTTDIGKVFQMSNSTTTIAPAGTVVGTTGAVATTGGVATTGSVATTGNVATMGGSTTGFICVPAEFLSSNSPGYLRTHLLAAHKTIQELNNKLVSVQEQLAAYESMQ